MVPGPLPMVRASMMVTAHATAAGAATALHSTTSWRGGRACTGRMTEAGPAWSAIAQPPVSLRSGNRCRSCWYPRDRSDAAHPSPSSTATADMQAPCARGCARRAAVPADRTNDQRANPSAVPSPDDVIAGRLRLRCRVIRHPAQHDAEVVSVRRQQLRRLYPVAARSGSRPGSG